MTTRYSVVYAPRAQRDLRKLPEKIATACIEFIRTALSDEPYRVALQPHFSPRKTGANTFSRVMIAGCVPEATGCVVSGTQTVINRLDDATPVTKSHSA